MFTRLWTAHLQDPSEIERFERSLQGSRVVLDRLLEMLDDKDTSMTNVELSLDAYDNTNWPYRQAHINGYKSCLKRIRKIITDPVENK
jgi:hypothetical protein